MAFNSLQFLVFFMVTTLLYYQLRSQKARVGLLLLASCYFYMSFVPKYILILGGTILIDYLAGIQIARSQGRTRKVWLIFSIVANIGVLSFFKYFNFFLGAVSHLVHLVSPNAGLPYLSILLPIGLSFHTFQALSYTIEVYRGNQPPEKNFAVYALYVLFYPQLVAGPIERPQHILPQLHRWQPYSADHVREGLTRMLWGFFKKVVIADRLAIAVDHCFNHSSTLSSSSLLVGAVFYSFQIYCDFSGYSDIALGAAKVMGIRLMENFSEPYASSSIREFWSRWHISLSSWFRDYVYIPLGGNRRGEGRRRVNLLIVFLLSGLWHGAAWTFVIWGGLHGLLTLLTRPASSGRRNFLRTGLNFLLVTLCWIFFRAPSLREALTYLGGIFRCKSGILDIGLNGAETFLAAALILILLLKEHYSKGFIIRCRWAYAGYFGLMVLACYFLGVFGENQFIYFQF